jgi:tetratricopeptide (TPR) repeat protein
MSQEASLRKKELRIMRTSAQILLLAALVLSCTVSIYAQEKSWKELNAKVQERCRKMARKDEAQKLEARAKKIGSEMHISIILVKTKSEAQRILQKLGVGADFAELASQYSIGPGKAEGGDMGFFAPGDLMEELNAVALDLRIGEYSGIVETTKGYFILMKTDEKSPSELMAAQAQEKLWKELTSKVGMLYQQGRYSEATKVAEEAFNVAKKTFGPEHPYVAVSLNNLASLYEDQNRYAEAEPLYKRSLKMREKAFGKNHPSVATALNNLALVYQAQGRYSEAEPLYNRSLKIYEKALGPEHPHVATSLNNLALFYEAQGKYAKAEPLYKRAIKIYEKALGPEHPHVAPVCENLAKLYRQIGKEDEAKRLEERARKIRSNQ